MQIKRLNNEISVSPQIAVNDIKAIADMGFRSILCNRPDGEAGDQPLFEEIRASAEKAALKCVYLPVTSGNVADEDARAFAQTVRELPGPVLAYCRTGTRSVTLWSLANAERLALPEILTTARNAGYDMSGLTHRLASGARTPVVAQNIVHDRRPATRRPERRR